jgi:hypothetical protein
MTGRTTRIAAVGAGALLTLGIIGAAPAGASDGVQTDATVSAGDGTADALSQTLGLVNRACVDAANVTAAGSSALASDHGIAIASDQAGTGLKVAVSLPALTGSVPVLGSLPIVGSAAGRVQAKPLDISCATSGDGTSLGLSAAGIDALVQAIAPGVDLSSLDLSGLVPAAVDASTAASASASAPGVSGRAAASPAAPSASSRATGQSPAVRASASAAPRTATASLSAQPASSSGGIVGQTLGSPGALARTGAGIGLLGLLGTALVGSGRLLAVGRKLLRIS